ncbi:MAG: LysR family transcriptional regulator [Myxococcales bacterium]|nr:LysR family transcriptional regulator [Myxococcales bacterium]
MRKIHDSSLDLNLLRVLVTVADAGSVTEAASRLYLTQSAVSAALARLDASVGERLWVRAGRGLALSSRGAALVAAARPMLAALYAAAFQPAREVLAESERVLRLGLSDASMLWLAAPLVRSVALRAPKLRMIFEAVSFRTVAEGFTRGGLDLAVTVADALPAGVAREALFTSPHRVLFDRAEQPERLTVGRYFKSEHVIVSYNGDLRGVVEDATGRARDVRLSVCDFSALGPLLVGSQRLATVPGVVADCLKAQHSALGDAPLPFKLAGQAIELLWSRAATDDPVLAFLRDRVRRIARRVTRVASGPQRER